MGFVVRRVKGAPVNQLRRKRDPDRGSNFPEVKIGRKPGTTGTETKGIGSRADSPLDNAAPHVVRRKKPGHLENYPVSPRKVGGVFHFRTRSYWRHGGEIQW
jgi:hypothetical protein